MMTIAMMTIAMMTVMMITKATSTTIVVQIYNEDGGCYEWRQQH